VTNDPENTGETGGKPLSLGEIHGEALRARKTDADQPAASSIDRRLAKLRRKVWGDHVPSKRDRTYKF